MENVHQFFKKRYLGGGRTLLGRGDKENIMCKNFSLQGKRTKNVKFHTRLTTASSVTKNYNVPSLAVQCSSEYDRTVTSHHHIKFLHTSSKQH